MATRSPRDRTSMLVTAVVVALLAVVLFVFLRSPDGVPATLAGAAGDGAPTIVEPSDGTQLASSAVEPRSARVEATQQAQHAAGADQGPPVSARGISTWRDLVQVVDARTGQAVDGAVANHVQAGTRVAPDARINWGSLDDTLSDEDRRAPGILVLDTDSHTPALVDVARALVADAPIVVEVWPSASVRVDVLPTASGTSLADVQRIFLVATDAGADPAIESVNSVDPRRRADTVGLGTRDDFVQLARRRTEDDLLRSTGASVHTGSAFERDPVHTAVFRPLVMYLVDRPETGSVFFENVPALIEHHLAAWCNGPFEIEPYSDEILTGNTSAPFEIERGGLLVATLRLLGIAGVRGALPLGASDGMVELMRRGRDGYWVALERNCERDAGDFIFERLRPGAWRLDASWRDDARGHVRVARMFDLVAGEVHDVGVLAPNAGIDVTLVPRVEIDGALDPTFLGGALLDTEWRCDHSGVELFADTLESASFERLEPVVLRGLLGSTFDLALDRPELPGAASVSLRFVQWRYESHHDLGEGLTVELVLCLASAPRTSVNVVLPPQTALFLLDLKVLAQRADSEEVRDVTVPGFVMGRPEEQVIYCYANLDVGVWDLFASIGTQTPFVGGSGRSWYGATRVDVRAGVVARIELAPAATVVFGPQFDWKGPAPSGFFQVVPVDAPDGLAPLAYPWMGDGVSHSAAVDGLAPDTEYRVLRGSARFRTGATGTRVVLD